MKYKLCATTAECSHDGHRHKGRHGRDSRHLSLPLLLLFSPLSVSVWLFLISVSIITNQLDNSHLFLYFKGTCARLLKN